MHKHLQKMSEVKFDKVFNQKLGRFGDNVYAVRLLSGLFQIFSPPYSGSQ